MVDADAYGFIARCREHKTSGAMLDDLLASMKCLGFDHLIVSGVPIGAQKLKPLVELMGWPDGWFERYCEAEHAKVDKVCIYSARSYKPFYWSDIPRKWAETPGNRIVEGEASEFGISSGFAVPMASFDRWQSVVSFASSASKCQLSEIQQSQLVTMAMSAATSIEALAHGENEIDLLTERQKEVLLWIAEGKTAWETSVILGLSEATVVKHAKDARAILGASTTTQAVVEAIRRRAIHP